MHFITYPDHKGFVRLDREKFEVVERQAWQTHGHAYIGQELWGKISKKYWHKSEIVAWLPADEGAGEPALFKCKTIDDDYMMSDLEAHEVEEGMKKLAKLGDAEGEGEED